MRPGLTGLGWSWKTESLVGEREREREMPSEVERESEMEMGKETESPLLTHLILVGVVEKRELCHEIGNQCISSQS